jgi:hypothetical protein
MSDAQPQSDAADGAANGDEQGGLFPVPDEWFTIGVYLFLFVWMGYMVFEALGYSSREDYLFPLVIGVPVMLMIVLRLLRLRFTETVERLLPEASRESEDDPVSEAEEDAPRRPKRERELYELFMIGWVILLPFMMFTVGMGWTLIFYTFGFTWFFTRNLKTAAMVTAVVIAFVWVLFIELLGLIIWDGMLDIPGPLRILADFRRTL